MIKKLFKKNKPASHGLKKVDIQQIEAELKTCAENFISRDSIEILEGGKRVKLSPLKWLYPGYGEYRAHAIVPNATEKIATEIVNDPDFVNAFLHNKRDINGFFGFFVARVECNYVIMSDNGNKMFSAVKESDIDDYDTVVLIKQSNRLFPKFNKETFSIDFKHIEVFGEVFNKLKSKLSVNYSELSSEQMRIMHIDIPTYTHSSIKIESSVESYNIFKLSEVMEKLSQDAYSVPTKNFKAILDSVITGIEKVKDILYGSENAKRFMLAIENLEKIANHLDEMKRLYNILQTATQPSEENGAAAAAS